MPLPTLACTITSAGITAPSYDEILASLKDSFRTIYGADAYLEADSMDGQLLAIFAKAVDDANQMTIKVYNSFSPTNAQGAELSSLVKINGIRRRVPTNSTAIGTVVGQTGTKITGGQVKDANGNIWNLPQTVTIPVGGSINVTVTAAEPGAIQAASGTIDTIANPQFGWQSFVSTTDATPGAPVESDADLRRRQEVAASLPAQTPLAALQAALANLDGVLRVLVYENSTGSDDANGAPPHSIYAVVDGGDTQDVVDTIGAKKTPGAATFGTTTGTYVDPDTGISYDINYFEMATNTIHVAITLTALDGWSTAIEAKIKANVAAFINSLGIGQGVAYTRMFPAAYLVGDPDGQTFEITALTIAKDGGGAGVADIPIDFDHAATNNGGSDITFVVS